MSRECFGTEARALRHPPASCGKFIVIVQVPGWSAGAPPIAYLHNHIHIDLRHVVENSRMTLEHKQLYNNNTGGSYSSALESTFLFCGFKMAPIQHQALHCTTRSPHSPPFQCTGIRAIYHAALFFLQAWQSENYAFTYCNKFYAKGSFHSTHLNHTTIIYQKFILRRHLLSVNA